MASPPATLEPAYAPDDRWKPEFVRVSIQIPHLKVKRQMDTSGSSIIPKFPRAAVNATIETEFQDESFSVIVKGDRTMQNKIYKLHIRKLPKPISPAECSFEVKKDRILVYLKKVVEESWYPALEQGLDMYESESSGDEG